MITQSRLKDLLSYDPDSGVFRWTAPRRGVVVGQECGRISVHGYREICVDCKLYRANRLAFMYMLNRWPIGDAEHENRDKSDNRWSNLRDASRSQNSVNVAVKASNKSGFIGVHWDRARQRWHAQIRVEGRKKNLGRYLDPVVAARVYDAAAVAQFGEFAELNFPDHRVEDAAGLRTSDPNPTCFPASAPTG